MSGLMFRRELADKVMAGEKTVTRRALKDNPRSPWSRERAPKLLGKRRAVCPGRGVHGIGFVRVLDVRLERLGHLSDDEARLEGFEDAAAFEAAFKAINGSYDPCALVWRIQFEVAPAAADQGQEESR